MYICMKNIHTIEGNSRINYDQNKKRSPTTELEPENHRNKLYTISRKGG